MAADKDHIPALDGLRGFAALVVVLVHAAGRGLLSFDISFTAPLGVSLFFTLSGFLMAYLYAGQPFDFRLVFGYGISRFARILPVYLLVIVASYLIYPYIGTWFVYAIDGHNLLRHLLLSGNVSVFWSIPPEIQFYVFFVLIWWAVAAFGRRRFLPMALVAAACLVMLYYARMAPGTTLPSKLSFFLMGTIMGIVRSHRTRLSGAPFLWGSLQGILFGGLVTFDCFSPHESLYLSWVQLLLCGGLILAFSYPGTFADVLFANIPMRRVGAWSFSLYLLHEPLLQMGERASMAGMGPAPVMIAMAISVCFLAAFLAHVLIEHPAQKFLKKTAVSIIRRFTQPIAPEMAEEVP